MSTTEVDYEKPDTFGNWLKPTSGGLFGLSNVALCVAAAGVVLALLFLMAQQIGMAFITVGLTALAVLVGFIPFGDRTILDMLGERRRLAVRRSSGETFYVSGALSTLPAEVAERLPGALVDVETISGTTGENDEYTLLFHREVGQLAAVLGCAPDGAAMQQQSVVNAQVANFGGWLAGLAVEDGLSGATVVVDSASESSAGMVQSIKDAGDPNAPTLAQQVIDEACGALPARTSTVNVYATLVYDAEDLGAPSKDDLSEAVAEIAARLPGQKSWLSAGGGGLVEPLADEELGKIAQLAYCPSRDQEMALDELAGKETGRPFLQAGPEYFDDNHGEVSFHDGVASMTVMMTAPPKAHITARSLDRLFGPNPKFLRKRVAIFYRPIDAGAAVRKVDQQVRNSQFRMDVSRSRPTSMQLKAKAVAERTEAELTDGAQLSLFMVMVTVTFEPTERAYREARTQLKSLMNQSRMSYRWVRHAGSAAFHTTLPFGVLPWLYSKTPLWLEERL